MSHQFLQGAAHKRALVARQARTTAVDDPVPPGRTTARPTATPSPTIRVPPLPTTTGRGTSSTGTGTGTARPTGTSSGTSGTSSSIPTTTSSSSSSTTTSSSSTTSSTSSTSDHAHTTTTTSSAPAETSTIDPAPSSGLGTGGILGVVAGSIAGVIFLCAFVAFIIRHMRKKRRRGDAFSDQKLFPDDTNDKLIPRAPSVMSRRPRLSPAQPGPAYPFNADTASIASSSVYTDRTRTPFSPYGGAGYASAAPHGGYTPVPPQGYGALPPQPFSPYMQEQPGHGAPPVPGTYGPGAYAAYGAAATQGRYGAYGGYNNQYPQSPQPQMQQPYNQYIHGFQNQPAVSPQEEAMYPNPFASAPNSPQAPGTVDNRAVSTIASTAASSSAMHTSNPDATADDAAPPAYIDDGSHERLKKNEKATYVSKAGALDTGSSAGAGPSSAGPSTSSSAVPSTSAAVTAGGDAL